MQKDGEEFCSFKKLCYREEEGGSRGGLKKWERKAFWKMGEIAGTPPPSPTPTGGRIKRSKGRFKHLERYHHPSVKME